MAYSYPLTVPNHNFASMSMRMVRKIGSSISPFTYKQQVFEHPGVRWEAEVTLPPLTYNEARDWEAFFAELRGTVGTFKMYNPLNSEPRGTANDATLLNTGTTIPEAGNHFIVLTQNNLGSSTLKKGDYMSIKYNNDADRPHLHMVVEDATITNGSDTTVYIQPPLRAGGTAGSFVDVTNPDGIWRLATPNIDWSINEASLYGFTFACVEADL